MVSLEIVNSYYTDMGVTSSLLTLQKKREKKPRGALVNMSVISRFGYNLITESLIREGLTETVSSIVKLI